MTAAATSLKFRTDWCGDHTVQTAVAMHPELNLATTVLAVRRPFHPGSVQLVLGLAFIKTVKWGSTRARVSAVFACARSALLLCDYKGVPFTSSEIILDRWV